MKVLLINKYHYVKGGSDRVYLEMSKLLESHGHQVIHFSTQNVKNEPSPTQEYFVNNPGFLNNESLIRRILLAFRYIYSFEAKRKLRKLLFDHKPDIVHLHIFDGELSLSILPVVKKAGIPVFMTLHDYKMLCPIRSLYDRNNRICEKCANGNYFHSIKKRCNRNLSISIVTAMECFIRDWFFPYKKYVDKFLPVSNFSKSKHLEYKPKLSPKSLHLPNFVKMPAEVNYDLNEHYYLYFGRLSREKGLISLLQAFGNMPHLELKIAGTGDFLGELQDFCNAHQLTNVKFLGYLQGAELHDVVRKALFSIAPSEWFETFGLNILESMSHGTPVLGASIGGITDLIVDGETGFLFDAGQPGSIIDSLERSSELKPGEYSTMSMQCHNKARQLSSESFYKSLMELYYSALDHKT